MSWKDNDQIWSDPNFPQRPWANPSIIVKTEIEGSLGIAAERLMKYQESAGFTVNALLYSGTSAYVEELPPFVMAIQLTESKSSWGRQPYKPKGSWTSRANDPRKY